jgi:hypothetical protein
LGFFGSRFWLSELGWEPSPLLEQSVLDLMHACNAPLVFATLDHSKFKYNSD